MSFTVDELVGLMHLEPLEKTLFRGASQDLGLRQLFGGQVLGQALSAASLTVNTSYWPHSLHGYFMRPGDARRPVVYQVDTMFDGDSFVTRRVTAIQKGRPIFLCSASFHRAASSTDYQYLMPAVETPESLAKAGARMKRFENHPIEFLLASEESKTDQPARKLIWFRLSCEIANDPILHLCLLAYSSDFNLLTTALLPHGIVHPDPRLQIASLDHAIWFHREISLNSWLLYDIDSPWAGCARGFSRGCIYKENGLLAASTAQEGLTRMKFSNPTQMLEQPSKVSH